MMKTILRIPPFVTPSSMVDAERGRLLSRLDGKPRRNLCATAAALTHDLSMVASDNEISPPSEVIAIYNLSALLEYHLGAIAQSNQVCWDAIRLCRQMYLKTSNADWLAQMVQPYINIGRLHSFNEEWSDACVLYRALYDLAFHGRDLAAAGIEVRSNDIPDICKAEPNMLTVIRNVYVYDSLRALFWGSRYEEVLDFLERIERDGVAITERDRVPLLEARCRALTGLQQSGPALDTGRELIAAAVSSRVPRLGLLCLIADIYRLSGSQDASLAILSAARQHLSLQPSHATECSLGSVILSYRLGLCELCAGELEAAQESGQKALSYSQQLGDEPYTIKASMLLLHIAGQLGNDLYLHDSGRDSAAELLSAATHTEYRTEKVDALLELSDFYRSQGTALGTDLSSSYLNQAYDNCKTLGTKRGKQLALRIASAIDTHPRCSSVCNEGNDSLICDHLVQQLSHLADVAGVTDRCATV